MFALRDELREGEDGGVYKDLVQDFLEVRVNCTSLGIHAHSTRLGHSLILAFLALAPISYRPPEKG